MYVTDLDFADNITLLTGTMANAQSILAAVEENVVAVGLCVCMKPCRIYIRVDDFSGDSHPTLVLRVRDGEIVEVSDFRYLGTWIKSSQ